MRLAFKISRYVNYVQEEHEYVRLGDFEYP